MKLHPSRRIAELPPYAFAEVDAKVAAMKESGADPIDFGVGDPTDPPPDMVRDTVKSAVDAFATAGYPSYVGSPTFREAATDWVKRRFGVALDPATQICATIGSKEAVFNMHEGFVDPGDVVIQPSPGYPPYSRGTRFAEGVPYYSPLTEGNGFLPDLDPIPEEIARKARILWLCHPNNPTGRIAPPDLLERTAAWCRKHGILFASDEAYIDFHYTESAPRSALEFGTDGTLAFFSLSKRSAMTGYRVGFVAGDPEAIAIFKKVKTNIDSGTPDFIQAAAATAWSDEEHVVASRERTRERRDLLCGAFRELGLPDCTPEATLYVWQRVPEGMTSLEFIERLLDPAISVVATPGPSLAEPLPDGTNPGEGYVRFALVPSLDRTREAVERLRELQL